MILNIVIIIIILLLSRVRQGNMMKRKYNNDDICCIDKLLQYGNGIIVLGGLDDLALCWHGCRFVASSKKRKISKYKIKLNKGRLINT